MRASAGVELVDIAERQATSLKSVVVMRLRLDASQSIGSSDLDGLTEEFDPGSE